MQNLDVKIEGAFKKYGSNVVLNNIDLEVKQGELLTLLGPSGCGKSTTLNLIAGFLEVDRGDVYIKGKKMNGVPPHKRDLGMVFQAYSLFPHMTVYENLNFGLGIRKLDKEEKKRRIKRALELVRLTGLESRYPRELSGGQRQRVAIARALVVEPELLLLDEPLSNLDAKLRHELRAEIKRLQKEVGVTTIFVTHDQEEALSMSDRVVVMNQGMIEQIGTPTEIYQRPKTEFVFQFIGKSNNFVGQITEISQKGINVDIGDGIPVMVEPENVMGQQQVIAGDEVKVYIRPEMISIYSITTEVGQERKAQIMQMNYLGSAWEIEVLEKGTLLQVLSPKVEPEWTIGSEVVIHWKACDLMLVKK